MTYLFFKLGRDLVVNLTFYSLFHRSNQMIRAHIFKLMLALAIGIVACAGIKDTSANDSYDDIIKYRQQVMIANAAHITAIFSVINGKTDFVEQIAEQTKQLKAINRHIKLNKIMARLFFHYLT